MKEESIPSFEKEKKFLGKVKGKRSLPLHKVVLPFGSRGVLEFHSTSCERRFVRALRN
ncbi:hypothetical protein HGB47_02820 [Leptospira yasudae]|uniref:hypothetical protein n=1 Tax=Leptospira yasudae TaxID=2202201 RepID=UPI001C4F1900|nr:hypothetical protein [Leptospira yasudae]MBW0432540.1 hypothetical protein [Leptospira yasudae]